MHKKLENLYVDFILNHENMDFQISFETKFAWFWCIWNFDPHVHFYMIIF